MVPSVFPSNSSRDKPSSVKQSFSIYKLSYFSIVGILNRSSNPIFDGPKALGPIALGQISGNVVASEETIENKIFILITLASSISLSLAIINLLPFPALDGGRLAFLFIEIFRRGKKVPESIESYIHGLGCHKKRPAQRLAEFREEAQCCAALCYPPEKRIMNQI